ncbi:MAG TPA: SHD1 domain-containing protein [Pirellulales bacterium]|jgi:hypothetical protein|nr:SHD1 domain-containing protein [Pirellulales bacterium]
MRFLVAVAITALLSVLSAVCFAAPLVPPAAPVVHVWTDATGRFRTEAILVGGDRSQVQLKKVHGSLITVPLKNLSSDDQQFALASLRLDGAASRAANDQAASDITAKEVTAKKPILPDLSAAKTESPPSDWLGGIKSGLASVAMPSLGDANAMAAAERLLSTSGPSMPENMIYVRLSRPFLERTVYEQVSDSEPVNETVLGSRVGGTSTTTGTTEFELEPSDRSGLAEIRLFGSTTYDTVADAGPIQVFTSGVTRFASAKAIRIDGNGIALGPAVTNAETSSTVKGVSTSLRGLRGRIALRIGARRAGESRQEAAVITSRNTAGHINQRFDRSASERVADFWTTVNTQLAALPPDCLLRKCCWQASTTKDALQIVIMAPPAEKYPRVPPPAATAGEAEVEVQVHVALVRYAIANDALQRFMQPVAVRLAALEHSTGRNEQIGRPGMNWSKDGTWLTMSWPAGGRAPTRPQQPPVQPSPSREPVLASQSR